MECVKCQKELFLSLLLAKNAAFLYELIFNKKFDAYECPASPGDYHLTTMRWRFQKFTEASKSTVADQEQ